jgi:hypothetical protein
VQLPAFDTIVKLQMLTLYLANKSIDKNSDEYKQFKDRAGLPNWEFSLAQLFLDASCEFAFALDLLFGVHELILNAVFQRRHYGSQV